MNEFKSIWITWEIHRRSRTLAEHFQFRLYELPSEHKGFLRYAVCIQKTFSILKQERPHILVVQNPSIFLPLFALAVKPWFGYKLIVDRHTNFKFDRRHSPQPKWILFRCINRVTTRYADLTVVTNRGLRRIVRSLGGEAFVLPDKLPELKAQRLPSRYNSTHNNGTILFVCSFSTDEPIDEVIEAFSGQNDDFVLYITGNWKKRFTEAEIKELSPKVVFTGFIDDNDFISLMAHVDGVIVLTKKEFILNCGAYEALSLNKPLLLSNTISLRSYFRNLAVYTNVSSCSDIDKGLKRLKRWIERGDKSTPSDIVTLHNDWLSTAERLKSLISESILTNDRR